MSIDRVTLSAGQEHSYTVSASGTIRICSTKPDWTRVAIRRVGDSFDTPSWKGRSLDDTGYNESLPMPLLVSGSQVGDIIKVFVQQDAQISIGVDA